MGHHRKAQTFCEGCRLSTRRLVGERTRRGSRFVDAARSENSLCPTVALSLPSVDAVWAPKMPRAAHARETS
jgi:hypothetical protein